MDTVFEESTPSSSLPGNPTSMHQSYGNHNISNNASSALTPVIPDMVPPRRRRLLPRFRLSEPESRNVNNNTLNPMAADFVPTTRKASSSAKSGKAVLPQRLAMNKPGTADSPLIAFQDLFEGLETSPRDAKGKDAEILSDNADEVDEIHLLAQEMQTSYPAVEQMFVLPSPTPGANQHVRRLNAVTTAPDRTDELRKRVPVNCNVSAAVLYTSEPMQTSDTSGGMPHALGELRYLPLGLSSPNTTANISTPTLLTVLPGHRQRIDRSQNAGSLSGAVWPCDDVPVEIFDCITASLSREDVKAMRLVDREFERKVARSLFHTSVVPFNTELYDMVEEDTKAIHRGLPSKPRWKGKGRARDSDVFPSNTETSRLHWRNATHDADGNVYRGHGLRVFEGFGPHINRFGMSFEVAESQLSQPPVKQELDRIEAYHGAYDWPQQHYARFANLAGLEHTADEVSRMKAAFAHLQNVHELALSVDSGLGWLSGPDKSLRARVFERPSAIFGSVNERPDSHMQAAQSFWSALQESHRSLGVCQDFAEIALLRRSLPGSARDLSGLRGTCFGETQLWPAIDARKVLPDGRGSDFGVLYATAGAKETLSDGHTPSLTPGELTREQKEWLLETEWAQRAFLESYMLAIVDNPAVFVKVTTLNMAKLSSSFLALLGREHFWDALPNLADVTLLVSPDWRTVERDSARYAETPLQNPSEAVHLFHMLVLGKRVCHIETVKKLHLGWVGGGEHAEGIFARNTNILPAPITPLDRSISAAGPYLHFDYVEHLTLSNCWVTPATLHTFILHHSDKALKSLTLDSLSLTAHPRHTTGNAPAPQQAIAQQAAVLMAQPQFGLFHNPHHFAHQQLQHPQPQPHFVNPQHLVPAPQQWHAVLHQPMNNHGIANAVQFAQLAQQPWFMPGMPPLPIPHHVQNPQPANTGSGDWTVGHPKGSWPDLLNAISPGPRFSDYRPQPQPWDDPLPARSPTNLLKLELKSCGYVRLLNNPPFDQLALEPELAHQDSPSEYFRTRRAALKRHMMSTRDRYVAQIVQYMPSSELDALLFTWGLREGWDDTEEAKEAQYDGFLAGGTGRVSGVIERGMALM